MGKINYERRWNKVRDVLDEKGADAYVSKIEGNMRYLVCSDLPYHPASFGLVLYVVIPKNGEPIGLTSSLEEFRARELLPIKNIKIFSPYPLVPSDAKKRPELLKKVLSELKVKKALFDEKEDVEGVKVEEDNVIAELRDIKEPEEMARIRKAAKISDDAYVELEERFIAIGEEEQEAARRLENYMRKEGGIQAVSFPAIVAAGRHSAYSHHDNSHSKIKKGDMVIVDYGACYEGYCSDMTRTFAIGKVPPKLKEIYNIVLEANLKSIRAATNGADYKAIDDAGRKVIDEAGYGRYFVHSTGHGVGLEVHELPTISPTAKGKAKVGEVFTIEPGIYLPGVGGVRIEDMVHISDDGTEVITKAKKRRL